MRHVLLGFATFAALAASAGAVARMAPHHGAPAITVNGEAVPPMTITVSGRGLKGEARAAYMKRLGEAGLKVYYVGCATRWLQPGDAVDGRAADVSVRIK